MFRFTIRDVLSLTVVVGLALGWCLDHRWLAPRAADSNDKATMAKLIGRQCLQIDAYKKQIEEYESELAEKSVAESGGNQIASPTEN